MNVGQNDCQSNDFRTSETTPYVQIFTFMNICQNIYLYLINIAFDIQGHFGIPEICYKYRKGINDVTVHSTKGTC